MPTYAYRCKNCNYEFDQLQRIKDDLLKKCPSCGKDTLIRLIGGGGGLVFKGSGFYQTDYKKSNTSGGPAPESKSAKKKSKTESKSESKSESTSEAKPESKPETKNDSSSTNSSDSK